MSELTSRVRSLFVAWACSCVRPGWRAVGTTPDGRHLVTDTVESPEAALAALLACGGGR